MDVPGADTSSARLQHLESSTWYMMHVAAYTHRSVLDYVPGYPVQTHQVIKPRPPPTDPGKDCGGEYTAKNGSLLRIISPNYPDRYDRNEHCEWLITASSGSIIAVYLRDFSTERWFDYLDIGEGTDNTDLDTRVHHLSGFFKPWDYWNSDTSELWMTFTSDLTFHRRGFLIEFEEIFVELPEPKPLPTEPIDEEICGGNVSIPIGGSATILSPNYPENYKNDLSCVWHVMSESGKRINVKFVDFETEYCHDLLVLGDGHNETDLTTSQLTLSGSLSPEPFDSDGDKMWLTFTTDYSITARGFELNLTEIDDNDIECGGTLTITEDGLHSVTIVSPNYPDDYNHNDYCLWTINLDEALSDQHILAVVDDFETEKGYDWLEIGSGSDHLEFSTLLYRLSGSVDGSYATHNNALWVLWTTDQSVSKEGYSIQFVAVDPCGDHYTEISGNITSPGYPQMEYPHGSDCTWKISVENNMSILISFSQFALELDYDYVRIGEGLIPNNYQYYELSGSDLPKDIIVYHHQSWIEFTSDNSVSDNGFSLTYQGYIEDIAEPKPCGAAYIVKSGQPVIIESPNYPQNYPSNSLCRWNVTTKSGLKMTIQFRDFATELGIDWLDIGDGLDSNDQSSRVRHMSGLFFIMPTPVLSEGDSMWLEFTSDASINFKGFQLVINEFNDTETSPPKPTPTEPSVSPSVTPTTSEPCGYHIDLQNNNPIDLYSPNYPEDYDNNLHCEWTVSADPGRRIAVTYIDFTTELIWDYLEIGQGLIVDDASMRRDSGSSLPSPFTTVNNDIWFKFITDSTVKHRGFHLRLEVPEECGSVESISTDGSLRIQYPESEEQYGMNEYCKWIISSDSDQYIRVHVVLLDTEKNFDFLEIGEGNDPTDMSTRLLKASGNHADEVFFTLDSTVWMSFSSDGSRHGDGFTVDFYDDACMTVESSTFPGTLTSPNYPSEYAHNSHCIWKLNQEEGRQIRLTFHHFSLEQSRDYLFIGEGDDPYSTPTLTLTGSDLPEDYISDGNKVWFRFESDWTVVDTGFNITYEAECPIGYESGHSGRCYRYVYDPLPWDDARHECLLTTNGDLVILETEDEYQYVLQRMNQTDFWIGLSDRSVEDIWKWIDCSDPKDWQLNLADGGSNTAEKDCTIVTDSNTWSARECHTELPYICELSPKNFTLDDQNVQHVDAEALSPFRVHVTWDVSPVKCDILGYRVKYHRLNYIGGIYIVDIPSADSSEYTLTGLQSSTWYASYVAGYTSDVLLDYVPADPVQTHAVRKPPSPLPEPSKDCGGNLTAKSDSLLRITSPNYPDNYENNQICEWRVNASTGGNTLIVYLRDLRTEHLFDWVDIGEGLQPDDSDSRVHHMSGFFLPWTYWESSTDEVWITFSTDYTIAWKGFMLEIVENVREPVPTEKPDPSDPPVLAPECGGNITLTEDESYDVYSLNYPGDYDNDLECLWKVETVPGRRIEIEFVDFETEYCHDWLDIGNGLDHTDLTTSELHLSGSIDPESFQSVSNQAWMLFTTDYSITARGFHLIVKDIGPTGCGQALIIGDTPGDKVNIKTPNYPQHYSNNEICKWTISGPANKHILMTVNDFATERFFDWLEIGVGGSDVDFSSTVFRLSGSLVTGSYTSEDDGVWALFTSDNSISRRGFDIDFSAVDPCGGHLDTIPGTISSPLYPDYPYPHSSSCIWTIQAPVMTMESGQRIKISFSAFHLERNHDWLIIGNGLIPGSSVIAELTGPEIPKEIITDKLTAWLWFTSDNSVDREGFHLTYTLFTEDVPEPKRCGGSYIVKPGHTFILESPNYPQDYSRNERCQWNITTDSGLPMSVVFLDFLTEEHFDWVDIGNGLDPTDVDSRVRHESGSSIPPPFYSSGADIWVTFYTDFTIVERGFVLVIVERNDTESSPPKPAPTATTAPVICGGHHDIEQDPIFITSPNYEENYNNNDYCEWTVTSVAGNRIRIVYHDFETELRYDYLEIGRGHDITNFQSLLRHNSGSRVPSPFTTDVDRVWLKFVSDHSVTYKGFNVELRDNDCFSEHTITSGGSITIRSPGYPESNYDNNYFCEWIITTENGGTIRVEIKGFRTEQNHDWVDMGSGSDSVDFASRFVHISGQVDPNAFFTGSESLWMTFETDASVNDEGFEIIFYDDGCVAEEYTDSEGEILSPFHPAEYPNNANCVWFLKISDGHDIKVTFHAFRLEEGHDFLYIGYGNDPTSDYYLFFTGYDLPEDLVLHSSETWFRFVSDRTNVDTGFNITYKAICPTGYDYHIVDGEEKCYKFVTVPTKSWDEAREDCLSTLHGDLVIIDDQAELDFINAQMTLNYWIGYSDLSVEARWRWVNCRDASVWDQSKWGSGQPSSGLYEDCGLARSNEFYDEECMLNHAYVCEITPKEFEWPEDINVQAVDAVGISPYDIHVTWTVSDFNCDVIGYRVRYRRYDWLGGYTYLVVDGGDTDEAFLSNLESSTTYHCQWHVGSSGAGKLLLVHIRDFSTEGWFDWLDIGEGSNPSDDDSLVHHMSGHFISWDFWTSSTEQIWLTFDTDSTIHFRGFLLEIEEIDAEEPAPEPKPLPTEEPLPAAECGYNVTIEANEYVNITSPNYPEEYDNDMDCVWYLNTESGYRINVTFIFFDTEYCHDWFEVGNGPNHRDLTTSIQRVSGDYSSNPPDAVSSSSDRVWITFTSDYSITRQGFHVIAHEIIETGQFCCICCRSSCGGSHFLPSVPSSSVSIQTNNYPNNYGNNEYCHWDVETEDLHLYIHVNDFETERNFDWYEIGSGTDETVSSSLLYRFSGSQLDESYFSDSSSLWSVWTSDISGNYKGFNVTYFTVEPCGGDFTESDDIQTPLYPKNYAHNSYCSWNIHVNTGSLIHITFHDFWLEDGYDYLYIYEGSSRLTSVMVELTGDEIPKDILINADSALLIFTSDMSVSGNGFHLTYAEYTEDVVPAKPCGGEFIAKYDSILVLQSPNYPSDYYNNDHCQWNITSPADTKMTVTFRDFETERGYDWVDIGDGLDDGDLTTRIIHHSGHTLPVPIISADSELWMTFITDESISFRGFLLQIEVINDSKYFNTSPLEGTILTIVYR
ncbi:cubilin-like [Saccoglossus kowalevskii]